MLVGGGPPSVTLAQEGGLGKQSLWTPTGGSQGVELMHLEGRKEGIYGSGLKPMPEV